MNRQVFISMPDNAPGGIPLINGSILSVIPQIQLHLFDTPAHICLLPQINNRTNYMSFYHS
jgi:hypothetical protein